MKIDYQALEKEIDAALDANGIWVLSTAQNDYVTSRPMSVVHIGLTVFFQSNTCYLKHSQMLENPRVSLCAQNISIEGTAEVLGDWNTPGLKPVLELYRQRHPSSYERYGALEGQRVYKITPSRVKLWKYVDGEPVREVLSLDEREAVRVPFM